MEMDVNKRLPPELVFESVDDILYRIGLSFESTQINPKRQKLCNPLFISISMLLFIIKECTLICLSDDHEQIFIYFDGHLKGIRRHCDIIIITTAILTLSSQLIYYKNYRNGIKPTFLRIFQMMSGLVTPKSLGLTNQTEISKLIQRTRTLLKYVKVNFNLLPIIIIVMIICIYLANGWTLFDALTFGLGNGIVLALFAYLGLEIIVYQFIYFYIMCLYLKIKIKSMNERLIEMKRRKRFIRIRETLQSFDSLYKEINEYNTTFWSKFLLSFWMALGFQVSTLLYMCLSPSAPIIIRVTFFYLFLTFASGLIFIISTAASVNSCANKAYKILNSLIVSNLMYSKHTSIQKKYKLIRISNLLKVLNIIISIHFSKQIIIIF